ncbi:porin [Ralstonia solanacearum]|uniref:Porin n=1 Tax=Ralstonia solanacearum TaxID=305 RepID=A0AAW5ZP74_RALSL|nr:porin [Ralstonia solanacearum]MBB6590174.1 porin [Ralstonia solanacearum]MBB6594371.1 porin [Ralstonia solanacearum]MDB0540880.1 porin [Ralstonia solanacearum]MDB0550100.1 porin [Ralstonia solanacearum]MDB0555764.1 porin [Ralstonia solanacearum]
MKMKLFAAAVAALAAGGAYAQSSVTLYGVADVGVEWANKVPGGDGQGHSRVAMQSGNLSGSRWGLRGVEDLGGGLKGIFNLESGFSLDTGASGQSSRLFGRNAYVGLQGQWGQLTLGRQQNLLYDFALAYDPMAIAGRYSITSQDAYLAGRADNAIKYIGTFGGLSVSALYAFNRDGQETAGVNKLGREWSLGANYAAGPFSLGAVYDQSNGVYSNSSSLTAAQNFANATTQADIKEQRATIAGTYAFGPAKLYAGYRWYKTNLVGTSGSVRSNLYWLGAGYQATPALTLTGTAYYQQFKNTGTGNPWLFVVGTDYALSKRTDAYFNVAYAKNSSGSALGVAGFNGSSTNNNTVVSTDNQVFSNATNTNNQIGAVVGIRHKF